MDISLSRRHFIATAMVAALLAPNVLFADDSEVPGEVVLSTPFEFVKFSVNGKSAWENHEYTKRNKTLVIMGLARDQENEIVLTPRVEGYQPYTLVVKPSEYKRRKVRVRGRRGLPARRAVHRAACAAARATRDSCGVRIAPRGV